MSRKCTRRGSGRRCKNATHFFSRAGCASKCDFTNHWQSLLTAGDRSRGPHLKKEGILRDVFAQKCSAAWQGAPGQRLAVSIMLPGRQMADEWLDFMLSQRNLWPTFTTKRAPTERITERTFQWQERSPLNIPHASKVLQSKAKLFSPSMESEGDGGIVVTLSCKILQSSKNASIFSSIIAQVQGEANYVNPSHSSQAVLHNRNDMTNLFRASNWVSESKDSIVSRGVTTCTGMTAHTVILAQTRVGFLTGGRKKSFLDSPQNEQTIQLEEACARATVAIT